TQVANEIGAMRAGKARYASRFAPDFTVFDFIDTRETKLSAIIAALLDPEGEHSQGTTFLRAFLQCLAPGAPVLGSVAETGTGQDITVSVEHETDGHRYIDILIDLPDALIGIENKPWAEDQPNQVRDYAAYLED